MFIGINTSVLADYAEIITASTAAIALVFAGIQVLQIRSSTRETTAIESYRAYLRHCCDKPHLSSWSVFSKWSGIHSPDGICEREEEKAEAYLWFLSEVLWTCELVLNASRNDASWRTAIQLQLSYHDASINEVWEKWRDTHTKTLQEIVDKVLKKYPPSNAPG